MHVELGQMAFENRVLDLQLRDKLKENPPKDQ